MKRFLVFTFIAASLLLTGKSSFAYDDLVSNDKAVVRDTNVLSARGTVVYLKSGKFIDKDGNKNSLKDDYIQSRIPITGRYGVMDDFEVFTIVPIVSVDDGIANEAGIGDVWIGAKYNALSDNLLTLRAALDVPSGDDKKKLGNPGGFGVDFGALAQRVEGKLMLDGQVGVRWNGEDSDTKWTPGIGFYIDAESTYHFTDSFRAQIGLEYFNYSDGEINGKAAPDTKSNWLDIDIGARYLITEQTALRFDITNTLTGTNTNANLGVMLSLVNVFDF